MFPPSNAPLGAAAPRDWLTAPRGLCQGGNCEIPGKDDAEDFRRLLNTMEVLGFSVEEQSSIFRILSSVLHLGNVYFEKYEVPEAEPSCAPGAWIRDAGEGGITTSYRLAVSHRVTARRSPRW